MPAAGTGVSVWRTVFEAIFFAPSKRVIRRTAILQPASRRWLSRPNSRPVSSSLTSDPWAKDPQKPTSRLLGRRDKDPISPALSLADQKLARSCRSLEAASLSASASDCRRILVDLRPTQGLRSFVLRRAATLVFLSFKLLLRPARSRRRRELPKHG